MMDDRKDRPAELSRTDHTFVLRIRTDYGASIPLRATIRHLPSGTELSTADLTEVDDFIRLRVNHQGSG
jgi:hypothetical protein